MSEENEKVELDPESSKNLVSRLVEGVKGALQEEKKTEPPAGQPQAAAPQVTDEEAVAALADAITAKIEEKKTPEKKEEAKPPEQKPAENSPANVLSPEEIAQIRAQIKQAQTWRSEGKGVVETGGKTDEQSAVDKQVQDILTEMREHPLEALATFFQVTMGKKKEP